ncbi:hypothetical protein EK21DRAFT_91504 [Setomelanomma holmii]|uniref:Uncharacterized protein n=1 Tax=Setomelanomma holmii TaxID=210430 RepID=A0A9P4H4M0_9PLEO|nr:hypothetical protein EK21DRAFT_91504 [Setomelanomma holmii]
MSLDLETLFEERHELSLGKDDTVVVPGTKPHYDLQAQVTDQAALIEKLQHRTYSKVSANQQLPEYVVNRLHRLEDDNQRLRNDLKKAREELRAAESEASSLRKQIEDKTNKVKGANKKTRNARDVAGKEEEKAKTAVYAKQQHVKSEQKMRKEKNDALVALSEQRKITADLRAELEVEQSGTLHLRDTEGTGSNLTTVVVPMELLIRRTDYLLVQVILESNRISYIDRAKESYKIWKSSRGEEDAVKVVGANYVEDEKKDKLYGDMIEDGFMMTGAEHDGWPIDEGIGGPTIRQQTQTQIQHQAQFAIARSQTVAMSGNPSQGPGLRYPSNKKSIYDRNLNRSKNAELSRAAFAYLFIEMIAYAQKGSKDVGDLEQRLNQQGYPIGLRLLDLLLSRSSNPLASIRPTRILPLLQFIAQQVYRHLFGRPADALERSGSDAGQYMIFDNEPLVNQYISLPKELSSLNCAAFVAGVIEGVCDGAGFPTEGVTAHSVGEQEDGKEGKGMWPGKTVFLIKFKPEVLEREEILGRGGG